MKTESREWKELEKECAACENCLLCQTRKHTVFGVGNRHADIMFIGEGPGQQEDLQGVPFVGPAGQLLDEMLNIIDLNRNNCYITNIVKCRPPKNRDPLPIEQDACIPFLWRQIELVQPKILVCLGRIAGKRLISSELRITQEHGQWLFRKDMWVTAFFHPSALLRDPMLRPEAFDDLMILRDKIEELQIDINT